MSSLGFSMLSMWSFKNWQAAIKSELTVSLEGEKRGEILASGTYCAEDEIKTWQLFPLRANITITSCKQTTGSFGSTPLTCPRWWFLSQSCPPSVLWRAAVSSWLFSQLPQMLRLHLSAPIPLLLLISSVRLGPIASLPLTVSSQGLLSPGQLPSPSGWHCSPSPRSGSRSTAPKRFHVVFCFWRPKKWRIGRTEITKRF